MNSTDLAMPAVGQRNGQEDGDLAASQTAPSSNATVGQISFADIHTELPGLATKGTLWTFLTLGIYRFWYKTRLRQWYWRTTRVDGTGFVYHGTARELFIGFLIAVAIMIPLYVGMNIALTFVGTTLGSIFAGIFGLAFFALGQYGSFRSRRYRLTRTSWRGARFDQTGSGKRYVGLSMVHLLHVVLTLGLTYPVARRAFQRYRIENTRFGTLVGSFLPSGFPQMGYWVGVWGLFMGTTVLLAMAASEGAGNPRIIFFAGGYVFALLLLPVFGAVQERNFINGTRFGPMRLQSTLSKKSFLLSYLAFGACTLVILLVAGALFGIVGPALLRGEQTTVKFIAVPVLVLIYLGILLALAVLKETILNMPIWRRLSETTQIHGFEAIDQVLATPIAAEAAIGEGFADALDFGGA